MTNRLSLPTAAALSGIALLAGCAPTFEARVARFNVLPPPAGQTFTVAPREAAMQNSLEFESYAVLVRQNLKAQGFTEAASPADATMIVLFDYQMGQPREIIQSTPGVAWGGGWGGPGWGWGRGWNPYWGGTWGGGWGGGGWAVPPQINTITEFPMQVAMKIERKPDKTSLFEGRAETISTSGIVTQLVPNLIHAQFAEFPGISGQSVRVTFNPQNPATTTRVRPVSN